VKKNTKIFTEVKDWLAETYPLPIFDTVVELRTAYSRSLGEGLTVFEYKDDSGRMDKKAIIEVNALIDEILSRENIVQQEEAI